MIIVYNGIGANDNVYFSVDNFLRIMRENFQHYNWDNECEYIREIRLNFRDRLLPQEFPLFTLDDWIEYSGALQIDVEADEITIDRFNHNYRNAGLSNQI